MSALCDAIITAIFGVSWVASVSRAYVYRINEELWKEEEDASQCWSLERSLYNGVRYEAKRSVSTTYTLNQSRLKFVCIRERERRPTVSGRETDHVARERTKPRLAKQRNRTSEPLDGSWRCSSAMVTVPSVYHLSNVGHTSI